MWEMRRVPQPNVEIRRNFNFDQNGGENLWVKKSKEMKRRSQKFGRQNLEKNFRNRNME
jgi:hypothetical protein